MDNRHCIKMPKVHNQVIPFIFEKSTRPNKTQITGANVVHIINNDITLELRRF